MSQPKPKPWRNDVGTSVGLVIGFVLWWSNYNPARGLLQNLQLLIVPAALGMFVVGWRNRRKKVGPWDPKVIARNGRGTL
jgi:hypothetical protein